MIDRPPLRQKLPYVAESERLFAAIAERPWSIFLDSGQPDSAQGRYDIISCDPMATLVTRGGDTKINDAQGTRVSTEDPLELLRQQLGTSHEPATDLPFNGGAMGYFSYDLARRLENLPVIAPDSDQWPEMAMGIYDWAVIIDHQDKQTWLVGAGRAAETIQQWQLLIERFSAPTIGTAQSFAVTGKVESNMSPEAYQVAFDRVQRYIRAGDCYQVNIAQGFSVAVTGDPWHAYRHLRQLNPAPFAAYLNTPHGQVLSSSPERFIALRDRRVETKPIKGTVPRGKTQASDLTQIAALERSEKDRAENLMIVDLMRNDLGRSCEPGSIKVDKLFEVESFATVHHLVSTIEGKLAQRCDAIDLLRGCFPGGSITGAPKLRAMEIIEALEPERRGVYCGSIGYLGFDGNMDTNIAIRTLVHVDGHMRFCAGGGLVADSELEVEYQETFHKAAAMFTLLDATIDEIGLNKNIYYKNQ